MVKGLGGHVSSGHFASIVSRWGGMVKGVFEVSGNSRYNDAITELYHFPNSYLPAARDLTNDWIVYPATRIAGGRKAFIAAALCRAQ